MKRTNTLALSILAIAVLGMAGCASTSSQTGARQHAGTAGTGQLYGEWLQSNGDVWQIRADGTYHATAVAPSQPSDGVWESADGKCITIKQTNSNNPTTYRLQMTDGGRTLSGPWSAAGYSGTLTLHRKTD